MGMACPTSSTLLLGLIQRLVVVVVMMAPLLTSRGGAWPPALPVSSLPNRRGGGGGAAIPVIGGLGGGEGSGSSKAWGGLLSRFIPTWSRRRRGVGNVYAGVEPDQPVAFSSRQMAAVRALEAERPDRLFDDPLSALLAGEEAMRQARTRAAAAARPSQGVGRKIACRTRYFDDFLLDCSCSSSSCKGSSIGVFLLLGAGMDARAWRLPLNGTVVEVDTDDVMAAKEALLQRYCCPGQPGGGGRHKGGLLPVKATGGRLGVAADLGGSGGEWVEVVRRRVAEATGGLSMDGTTPIAVVMEGLTMYLNDTEVDALMREVGSMAGPGSKVGISLVDTRSLADAQASESALRRSWKWGCDEDKAAAYFEKALARGGGGGRARWKVLHVVRVGKQGGYPAGANYGCWEDVSGWRRKGKTLYVIAERLR